jgi:hypothetical protein
VVIIYVKDKISYMFKMEEDTVTLPKAPEGYEYTLRKKSSIKNKDPSELTPRQKATLKYNEKNREKVNEKSRLRYQEKKNKNLSTFGDTR